ncbi:MAG: sulfite exporter TauE/SafE family protein [Gammaproteobacteria bacterium]|nr:sulfite exporter TauE/SafE family protein [Gammaproteobacteria bacterium]MBT4193704.1 sulfite exporter TauE/SafE family protein [Gammaproteobacteria bacterium]MBT7044248.1 sulfite exporter TauE/SafE family protein [Gammaproteobacteria bacterium]
MAFEVIFLFMAVFLGGVINSIAGGGSFITFPALLFVGVPPVSANATNTFASLSGYLSGAFAFKKELLAHKKELPRFIIISFIGGITGAWLLLQTSDSLFREAIPWLLLFATVLFIFGEQLNRWLKSLSSQHKYASSIGAFLTLVFLLGVCIYGGFFNAGLGIIILSYLALAGYNNINTMNGIKLLVSSCVSIIAVVLFIIEDVIVWYEGSIVLVGTLVGGYFAAHLSRKLPQFYVRAFVIFASIGTTSYFFYDIYFS